MGTFGWICDLREPDLASRTRRGEWGESGWRLPGRSEGRGHDLTAGFRMAKTAGPLGTDGFVWSGR